MQEGTFVHWELKKKLFIDLLLLLFTVLYKKNYVNNMQWWIVQIKKLFVLRE